jgi:hypothetical protein
MNAEIRKQISEIQRRGRRTTGALVGVGTVLVAALAVAGVLSGCSTLDRAYKQEVTWTNAAVVQAFTNTVVVTNVVPVVTERTNIVFVTNALGGAVAGYTVREPVATNLVAAVVTNFVPIFYTNLVQVPVTNLVDSPSVVAAVDSAGSLINLFVPGVGSIVALALGGLYHGYRQLRNRQVNAALVQGVETARAVLTSTPEGRAMDAQFVKWLMDHQKEAGVFSAVSTLVDQLTDSPAAKMTAQEFAARVQQATQQRGTQMAAGS